jgi:hypothetical protein
MRKPVVRGRILARVRYETRARIRPWRHSRRQGIQVIVVGAVPV